MNRLVSRWRRAPMYAVLCRYGIGTPDEYGRGQWIKKEDVWVIEECIRNDPDRIEVDGRIFIWGSSKFDHVEISDFRTMFGG